MIKDYLQSTFRNIKKNKGVFLLSILSLAIGIASFVFAYYYFTYELGFDKFNAKYKDIYRVKYIRSVNGKVNLESARTFPLLGPTLAKEFPEILSYVRLNHYYSDIRYKDKIFKERKMYYVDSTFFSIFSYKLLIGNPDNVLSEPFTAVLTESAAKKYFGKEDPIGKIINLGQFRDFTITGICEDPPNNSHLKFNILFSSSTMAVASGMWFNNWRFNSQYTYILLVPGTSKDELEKKLPQFADNYLSQQMESTNCRMDFKLQPLSDIHLYSDLHLEAEVNGDANSVYFMIIIGIFILLVAWINYINLSMILTTERSKEIGVRKINGASKAEMFTQFFTEAIVINLIGLSFALLLIALLIPAFNNYGNLQINYTIFSSLNFWLIILLLFITGTISCGFYPSFVVSKYNPIKIIKNQRIDIQNKEFFKRGPIILQYTAAVFFAIGALIIYAQNRYMHSTDLGINMDSTLVVSGPTDFNSQSDTLKYEEFKKLVENIPSVRAMTSSHGIPGMPIYAAFELNLSGKDEIFWVDCIGVDCDYFPTLDIKMKEGRNFSKDYSTDKNAIIINESCAQLLGFASPSEAVGKYAHVLDQQREILGVVSDYHQMSLREIRRPIFFINSGYWKNFFFVKLNSLKNISSTDNTIKEFFDSMFPNNAYDSFFLTDFFNFQYKPDTDFMRIFNYLNLVVILLACLGLFGLSSYLAVKKSKEIAIKKVHGSEVYNVFISLSYQFLSLVLLGSLFAIPIAYIYFRIWLNDFAYKIQMTYWMFIIPIIIVIIITLISVGYKIIKIARLNPAYVLRNE